MPEKRCSCCDCKSCKEKYIDTALEGTLIAFSIEDENKAKSAKVIKVDKDKRFVYAETSYGKKYKVKYENVLWVKTGTRWPRGVYNLLKGNGESKNA